MANEPSWEDIFKSDPTPGEPVAQPPAAARPEPQPEPGQQYPPTRAYPAVEPERASEAAGFDPFADLFPPAQPTQQYPAAPAGAAPMSRRELREAEGHRRPSNGEGGGRGGSGSGSGSVPAQPKKKRSLLWLKITLPIVLVLGAVGGAAAYGWFTYNEQVRALLGIPLPTDYQGSGNGQEAIVSVRSGDIGSDVANSLYTAGVTMTFDAVYNLLLENPDISFTPGNWRLQKEMSAQSAVDALQDTANKLTSQLLLTEGTVLPDALETIAATTGIPIEEVTAAAADPTQYGVPAGERSLEGWLFPATYELDGTETAQVILQKLVTTMFERLDAAGVAPEDRHRVLTMASIIQREAGSNVADFYKVSRVFQNRIDQGINLESDATVAYGTGNLDTVWTTDAERADASNPYNTYANPGLPIGPIGLPGDDAIDAALNPVDGPWLFFVPINLATGETVFSETVQQHDAAVQQLREWCAASTANASYCE